MNSVEKACRWIENKKVLLCIHVFDFLNKGFSAQFYYNLAGQSYSITHHHARR